MNIQLVSRMWKAVHVNFSTQDIFLQYLHIKRVYVNCNFQNLQNTTVIILDNINQQKLTGLQISTCVLKIMGENCHLIGNVRDRKIYKMKKSQRPNIWNS